MVCAVRDGLAKRKWRALDGHFTQCVQPGQGGQFPADIRAYQVQQFGGRCFHSAEWGTQSAQTCERNFYFFWV